MRTRMPLRAADFKPRTLRPRGPSASPFTHGTRLQLETLNPPMCAPLLTPLLTRIQGRLRDALDFQCDGQPSGYRFVTAPARLAVSGRPWTHREPTVPGG